MAARPHPARQARYALSTVDPAPLPPHERQWRHPSELAPTAAVIDTPTNGRALILATGTSALLLVAVLVVALAPPRSSAPSAVSATTLPSATIELRTVGQVGQSPSTEQQIVRTQRSTMLGKNGLALVGAPNAVSAAPVGDAADFALAVGIPDDSEQVIVITTSHAYDLPWGDIDDIAAPNGSIVMTRDGSLLATFVSGELRLLVD
jgi:hypothetical protein